MTAKQMTETHRMLHKANHIAAFFEAYPHDKAVEGVADHIRKFWTPPMRHQLKEYVTEGAEDLHELVVEAAKKL